MILAHYTSIETLALILKNKTLRFTRLDYLDDANESNIYNSDAHKLFYVSCWSKFDEESIPQWNIYGNNKRGIIILLDSQYIDIPNHITDTRISDYVNSNKIECTRIIYPNVESFNQPIPVNYVKKDELIEFATTVHKVNEEGGISVYGTLGKFKSNDWKFQDEYRYIVQVWQVPNIPNKKDLPVYDKHYIDIPFLPGFENNIKIITGALCNESDHIIIQALCEKYSVQNIEDSYYKNKLRK